MISFILLALLGTSSGYVGFSVANAAPVAAPANQKTTKHDHNDTSTSGPNDNLSENSSTPSKNNVPSIASLPSLQVIIDRAKPGDQVMLTEPAYAGPVVITKRLTLTGGVGTTLFNDQAQSSLVIQVEGVVVEQLTIRHLAFGEKEAAVLVQADQVTLRELTIRTRGSGIMLRNAKRGIVENNRITWDSMQKATAMAQKGNGIDLYKSSESRIVGNQIASVRDGIYLDNSKNLTILDNHISGSRYAIHCMYIDGTQLIGNTSEYNVTGAMIMGVRDVRVEGNTFTKQKDNVNSQGILLFDVQDSVLTRNEIEGNRVGLYLEGAFRNQLEHNTILRNFVGIQFVDSQDNRLAYNDFVANVIEAEAMDSEQNQLQYNYWDSAEGLDVNQDGVSDLPYAINPFYQRLVAATPAYQLFFQSPGMRFLSSMYEGDRTGWTTDPSPQMKPNVPITAPSTIGNDSRPLPEKTFLLLIAATLLLTACITIFYSRGAKT